MFGFCGRHYRTSVKSEIQLLAMQVKTLNLFVIVVFCLSLNGFGQRNTVEKDVINSVKRFYAGFDDGTFLKAEEYTTEDWNHINPMGGRTIGRKAVLNEVRAVHSTSLKGVTDTPESFDVKFLGPDAAMVVVPSLLSAFTTPDGVKHENRRNIRTFVLVNRAGRWLIMHDHNTFVAAGP